MPKRSYKMFPVSEIAKVFNIMKKKRCIEIANKYNKINLLSIKL
jgi:hypothetical protein